MISESRHLVHVFSTFAPGGPQMRAVEVLGSLPSRFRHTVLATNNVLTAREKLRPGLPVEFAEVPRPAGGGVRRGELGALLRKLSPDLLLTYNWGATDVLWLAAMGRRIAPMVHAEDGFGPDEIRGQLPRRVWTRRLLLRFAEVVVVPSRTLEEIAVRTWWMPRRRVLYVPNGIDLGKFTSGNGAAFREKFGIPADAFVVGQVAHLRGEKRPSRLLEAFAHASIPGAHLVFVGDGPERALLDEIIRQRSLDGRVHFAGFLQNPVDAYRAFDVFALSSDTEQMPISVLEAMGCGLPVVSTDVGDVKEMLAPANAPFVSKLGDEAAYAQALVQLFQSAEQRRRVGHANRARCAAHFSLEQQNNAYRDLYDRFAAGSKLAWRSEHFRS